MKILEYKLERLLKESGIEIEDPKELVSYLLATPQRRRLINLMTVPKMRFFREKEQLEVLFDSVLRGKSLLNLGSVGCSTGQEPYTLAMMMALRGIGGKVVGMDINEKDIPEEYRIFVSERGTPLR